MKRKHPGGKVAAILETSKSLFGQRGFEMVPLMEIADTAHVAGGTIIYHFKTKDNLISILAWDCMNRLCKSAASNTGAGNATGLDRIKLAVRSFFNHLADDPDDINIVLRYCSFDKAGNATPCDFNFDMTFRNYLLTYERFINQGNRDRSLSQASASAAATLIVSLLLGSAWMVIYRGIDARLQEELATSLVCRNLAGATSHPFTRGEDWHEES